MNCSTCQSGTIRLIPGLTCDCGHPVMLCDGCRHAFQIKHDVKNLDLLPPQAELIDCGPFYNDEVLARRMMALLGGMPLKPEPVPTDLPTVEDMHELIKLFEGRSLADIYDMVPEIFAMLHMKKAEGHQLSDTEQSLFSALERWIKATASV